MGQSRLPWVIAENGPFLRMYASLGVRCHDSGDLGSAKTTFEDMLRMNPDDNQGVRGLLCSCYFALGEVEPALKLCARFEDDGTPAIMFGRVLALLRSGRTDEAKRALFTAAKYGRNIATEITEEQARPSQAWRPGPLCGGWQRAGGPPLLEGLWKVLEGDVGSGEVREWSGPEGRRCQQDRPLAATQLRAHSASRTLATAP